jgi:hypothetical protein
MGLTRLVYAALGWAVWKLAKRYARVRMRKAFSLTR